jgi:uncharacterized protein
MNKISFLVSLLLITFIGASAQAPTEKTLLWQVSGNGLTTPSYLFGTFHLMCPDELKMPAIVKQKFNSTKQLFLEVDMDDPGMMMEMLKGMQMNDTSTLEGLLKEDYDKVSSIFQSKTGMPLKLMSKAKPMLLMSMIYPSIIGCQPVSWDGEFLKLAQERNVEVKGLETVEDQVKVFDSIPYKQQADVLKRTVFDLDSARKSYDELANIYKQKDLNKMYELAGEDKDLNNYEAVLLKNRNHNWIPIIGKQATTQSTFFAFGAGHLGGKEGVISLLRKAGFQVTPVFY